MDGVEGPGLSTSRSPYNPTTNTECMLAAVCHKASLLHG
jgi:hypothetical protein